MSAITVLDGLAVLDLLLTRETKVELRPDGRARGIRPVAWRTLSPPITRRSRAQGGGPGAAWAALGQPVRRPGGAWRRRRAVRHGESCSVAGRRRSGGSVHLFNSGTGMPEVDKTVHPRRDVPHLARTPDHAD